MSDVEAVLATWTVLVVEPAHDQGCPGGGDYCASHCPVPERRELSDAEKHAALQSLIDAEKQRAMTEALDEVLRVDMPTGTRIAIQRLQARRPTPTGGES